MIELLTPALVGFGLLLASFTAVWALSLRLENVAIVDSWWGPSLLLAAAAYRWLGPDAAPRQILVLSLLALWAVRLGGHLLHRTLGEPEDRRYREMRERHEPGFRWKSLWIVFWLQAGIAWILTAPHLAIQAEPVAHGWFWTDAAGLAVFAVGFLFESVADLQMARFRSDPANEGEVLDSGLWRYSRHPNYFGELCIGWSFWLFALGSPHGGWTIVAPLLLTFLLLRVSGVALTERSIEDRRPAYREYVRRTNALVPWFPSPENDP